MIMLVRRAKEYTTHILHDLGSLPHGTRVIIGGRIVDILVLPTNDPSAYIRVDDDVAQCSVYIAPDPYEAFKDLLKEGNEILIKGRLSVINKNKVEERQVIASGIVLMPKGDDNDTEGHAKSR